MKQYLDMCKYVLEHGEDRQDRTGTGTRSVFGYQSSVLPLAGVPLAENLWNPANNRGVHYQSGKVVNIQGNFQE